MTRRGGPASSTGCGACSAQCPRRYTSLRTHQPRRHRAHQQDLLPGPTCSKRNCARSFRSKASTGDSSWPGGCMGVALAHLGVRCARPKHPPLLRVDPQHARSRPVQRPLQSHQHPPVGNHQARLRIPQPDALVIYLSGKSIVALRARWSDPGTDTVWAATATQRNVSTWSIANSGGMNMSSGNVGQRPAPACSAASR